MKKSIFLLAATMALVGQLFNYSSVFADGLDNEEEYHYISDIIDFRKEAKAEIAEICRNSSDYNYDYCFLLEEIERRNTYGYKYDAVWQTDQRYFTITAINPSRSTIRMHYTGKHNENYYDAYITELYMYWIEDGKITPQLNYLMANTYTDQIRNGEPESGIHVIYAGSTNDGTPLFATNEETRLVLSADSNLMLDNNRQIYYTTVNNYGEQKSGFYNYGKCSFAEGLECKGAFYYKNDTYTYLFIPSEETAEDKELPLWTPSEPEIKQPEEGETEPEISSEITEDEKHDSLGENIDDNVPFKTGDDDVDIVNPNTPDTGANTMTITSGGVGKRSINFQWWIVAVIISALLVGSFMTKPRQNRRFFKKVGKKS